MAHPSLTKEKPLHPSLAKDKAEQAKTTRVARSHGETKGIFINVEDLKEYLAQIPVVNLTPILDRLGSMEAKLDMFNEHWAKRQEMYDLQMSILQKFDLLLAKEKGK